MASSNRRSDHPRGLRGSCFSSHLESRPSPFSIVPVFSSSFVIDFSGSTSFLSSILPLFTPGEEFPAMADLQGRKVFKVFNQDFIVNEQYNVTKELGQGAYGIVW